MGYKERLERIIDCEQKRVEELEYQIEIDSMHTKNTETLAKKCADENQRYKEEIESHAPHGRNHTNAQYVGLLNQITHYHNSLGYVRNEIYSALYSGKSEDVKNHYLINALRKAGESLQVEPD